MGDDDRYVVKAEGVQQLAACPLCKVGRLHGHGSQEQSFQDTPTHGKPVVVFIQRRRYRCTGCGKTLFEPVGDVDGKRQATARLVGYIRKESFTKTFAAKVRFRMPRILGIDELKIIGQYRAMITNIERKTVFDLQRSRAKADLLPYFRGLRDKDTIEWVAMDMYHVFKQVVRATLPQARIVVDRFHIQRMANEALEKLRKRIRKDLPVRQRLKLKDERFLLLKRQHDLKGTDMARALEWFHQFPELSEAYALKDGFLSIWDQMSRPDAETACAKWLGNRLAKDMTAWAGAIASRYRARMLYNEKARKDRAVVETVLVDDDKAPTNFEFQRMTTASNRKRQVQRVVKYGPYIPTLVRLLEGGYFE